MARGEVPEAPKPLSAEEGWNGPFHVVSEVRVKALTEPQEKSARRWLDTEHPLFYGEGADRMARCPTCEQWSPCYVRQFVATLDALRAEHRPTAEEVAEALTEVFGKECEDARNVGIRPAGGDELRAWNYVVDFFDQFAAKVAPPLIHARLYAPARPPIPAGSLDVAWAAVEAVLPEGDFRTIVLTGYRCKPEGCGLDYHAHLEGPNGEMLEGTAGTGNESPTAALEALAARLMEDSDRGA